MEFETANKEAHLTSLTTKERDLRSRIEDALSPHSTSLGMISPTLTINKSLANGGIRHKSVAEGVGKKSKKKKHN